VPLADTAIAYPLVFVYWVPELLDPVTLFQTSPVIPSPNLTPEEARVAEVQVEPLDTSKCPDAPAEVKPVPPFAVPTVPVTLSHLSHL